VKVAAPALVRKPGAWATLAKADADWDGPATNTAIADALRGGDR
jgi:hypothetical protein